MTIEEQLVEQFHQVHVIPPVVWRLGELINQPKSTLQDAEELICQDAEISVRLLQILKQQGSPLPRRVESIAQALSLLGTKELHTMLVTDTARRLIYSSSCTDVFAPAELWRHSAASALCCKMIAEHIFSRNGYEAYLCGLLHAIGLVPIAENMAAGFVRFANQPFANMSELLRAEQNVLGTDHCQVGYYLALRWGLSVEMAETIRDYRMDHRNIPPQSLVGILLISEYVTHKLGLLIFHISVLQRLPPALTAYMQENLEEYSVLAEDLPEELHNMLRMYDN